MFTHINSPYLATLNDRNHDLALTRCVASNVREQNQDHKYEKREQEFSSAA